MESTSLWANVETLPTPPVQFQSRLQPGGWAALAIDEGECVVVMDTLWFRYPLIAQWEQKVMEALVECKVMNVNVAGVSMALKKAAPEHMNVYLDPEPNKLKYPCKMCHKKSCAVTKAYLLWRRLAKREPCNLVHGETN
ncbi:uncharacterized protein NPIL_30911 [Nephila pilipes]|uniref:Uncharacterized protein n=1 Tax=Nephila pilipes TaxID=299642 RepID=A0A8X6M916_NEPPI|nr:uncharacterized protein NPIL_30911 [Nephila pilipes]